MTAHQQVPQVLLLVGGAIVLAVFMRALLDRLRVPTLIGYISLGFALHLADGRYDLLRVEGREILGFLEQVGIFCLLFRVGLESKLGGLLRELRRATVVWFGNVALSGALGYIVTAHVLGYGYVPSMFVAVALTATSVGMSIREWQEQGALYTRDGQLLVDVVEMDDLSAVVLMAMLASAAPFLRHEGREDLVLAYVLRIAGVQLVKIVLFGGGCLLFAAFVERHVTRALLRLSRTKSLLLFVLGSGFILTALGGMLGFSVAIGAFFAGLAFSREPEAANIDTAFNEVYDLFVPFLFMGIGLKLGNVALMATVPATLLLLLAAVVGKVAGGGLTALGSTTPQGAVLLGVSLVPRAAIALLVMEVGHELGSWAMPDELFSAMALVCVATWFTTPFILRALFTRWRSAVVAIA